MEVTFVDTRDTDFLAGDGGPGFGCTSPHWERPIRGSGPGYTVWAQGSLVGILSVSSPRRWRRSSHVLRSSTLVMCTGGYLVTCIGGYLVMCTGGYLVMCTGGSVLAPPNQKRTQRANGAASIVIRCS